MLATLSLVFSFAFAGPTGPPQLFELDYDECIEVECHTSAVYPPLVTPTSYLGTLTHRGPAPRPADITDLCRADFGLGAQGLIADHWVTPGVTSGACIPPDAPDPTDPTHPDPIDIDEVLDALDTFERDMDDLLNP